MKSVLISIQPKWCELIASGKKTVEVRKTRPKIDVPFKCYIYCTQGDALAYPCLNNPQFSIHRMIDSRSLYGRQMTPKEREESDYTFANSKVIGEFVCDKARMSFVGYNEKGCPSYWDILDGSCLTPNELVCYGKWKTLYGWHISDLVIYDKPKELGEFFRYCGDNPKCDDCEAHYYSSSECGTEDYCCSVIEGCKPMTRPPQSWCYIDPPTEKGGAE